MNQKHPFLFSPIYQPNNAYFSQKRVLLLQAYCCHINGGYWTCVKIEHFPTRMNRRGFPRGRESDSICTLAKEARMHVKVAFH